MQTEQIVEIFDGHLLDLAAVAIAADSPMGLELWSTVESESLKYEVEAVLKLALRRGLVRRPQRGGLLLECGSASLGFNAGPAASSAAAARSGRWTPTRPWRSLRLMVNS